MSLSQKLREAVVIRARGLCEYCQTPQSVVIEMEVDHIHPVSRGGATVAHNLCLSCSSCNHAKHDHITGIDAETGQEETLFNPRTQRWDKHFQWDVTHTRIVGLTPIGRATVDRLNMNRAIVVSARRIWVHAGVHPPKVD